MAKSVDIAFAPAVCDESRVLVLGSMPGQASLAARGYYAHPHNAFWRIVEDVLGVPRALPYDERLSAVVGLGLGLWDVVAAAHRPGSLDADIDDDTIEVADIAGLLEARPHIALVVTNGGKATSLYQRHVAPSLPVTAPPWQALPSTSPAHASMPYEQKRARWAEALARVL